MTAVQSRPSGTGATDATRTGGGARWVLVQGSWQHRALGSGLAVVVLALLLWGSQLQPFRLGQLTNVFIIAIAIAGLNLVTGYTGLLSIGHSAFFGLGAYTAGVLIVRYDVAPVWTMPVAVVVGSLAGAFVGLPSLRIRGLYLALVTLAIGVSFPEIVRRLEGLTGGAAGMVIRSRQLAPPSWTGLVRAERGLWMYWLSAVVLLVVIVLSRNLVRSRFGLSMTATRDNEIAAAANGVDVARTKILAFAVSGGVTTLAGSLFAMYLGALSPDGSFTLMTSIELVTGLVLGGVATLLGPLVGALAVVFLPYFTSQFTTGPLSGVIFGVLLIAIVFVMPEGIVGRVLRWGHRLVLVVPADHPRQRRPDARPDDQAG